MAFNMVSLIHAHFFTLQQQFLLQASEQGNSDLPVCLVRSIQELDALAQTPRIISLYQLD